MLQLRYGGSLYFEGAKGATRLNTHAIPAGATVTDANSGESVNLAVPVTVSILTQFKLYSEVTDGRQRYMVLSELLERLT
jgi:hypothetical protein